MIEQENSKTALRGKPSYIWRTGQERRLAMILDVAGDKLKGNVLECGCGVGLYLKHLANYCGNLIGLEYDFERARQAYTHTSKIVNGMGEELPFPKNEFDVILSHEVLEHVDNDRAATREMIRALRPGGYLVLFVPNRGYPFETHGFFWRKRYHFGNVPLINYLPRSTRDKLAPHVKVYSNSDLEKLFSNMPVRFINRTVIYGAYDNVIARFPRIGRLLRTILQSLEKTPLRVFGLSHFWVVEKI